jgi:hypothetical protein
MTEGRGRIGWNLVGIVRCQKLATSLLISQDILKNCFKVGELNMVYCPPERTGQNQLN